MKKRTKTILIALAVIALLVLLLAAASLDPAKRDIPFVRETEPFTMELWPIRSNFPWGMTRQYSMRTSYDKAVMAVQSELDPSQWKGTLESYGRTEFVSRRGDENIVIERGRCVLDSPSFASDAPDGGINAHGWIIVTTFRRIGFFGAQRMKMRQRSTNGHPIGFSIAVAIPLPIKGGESQTVDVSQGTSQMEGDRIHWIYTYGAK